MKILVTGGAGYVGSAAVPRLLEAGHRVRVYDLNLYGPEALAGCRRNPGLEEVKADLRDRSALDRALEGMDAVIHLGCISNDPSYELDPGLGKSINYDSFIPLVDLSRKHGVRRFIYASSSSVYGVKEEPEVTEELPLDPLTDYSKYKALCEEALLERSAPGFTCLIIRPATVCGYAPRLRLDLTVNILTHLAVTKGEITVFGGSQKRPNIHIDDMADLYVRSLEYGDSLIDRQIFNAGYENHTVDEIAEMVRAEVGAHVRISHKPTDDIRSYHISSRKIAERLGFRPRRTIRDAIRGLKDAFERGLVPNSAADSRYYNIKRMQEIGLK